MSPTPSADEIVLYTNTKLNRNGRSFESTCAKKSNENPLLKFVVVVVVVILLLLLRSSIIIATTTKSQNHCHHHRQRIIRGYLRVVKVVKVDMWYNTMNEEKDVTDRQEVMKKKRTEEEEKFPLQKKVTD